MNKRRRLNDDDDKEETKQVPVPLQPPPALDLHSASKEWPYRPTLDTQLKALARGDKFLIIQEHLDRGRASHCIRSDSVLHLTYACVVSLTLLWIPLGSLWPDNFNWCARRNCFWSHGHRLLVPIACLRSFFTHASEETIVVFTMRHRVDGHEYARKLILRPEQVLTRNEFNPVL